MNMSASSDSGSVTLNDMPAKPEELDEMISIRVSDADVKALEALVDRLPKAGVRLYEQLLGLGTVELSAVA